MQITREARWEGGSFITSQATIFCKPMTQNPRKKNKKELVRSGLNSNSFRILYSDQFRKIEKSSFFRLNRWEGMIASFLADGWSRVNRKTHQEQNIRPETATW